MLFLNWILAQDILGPILSMFLTITIIQWLIPKLNHRKKIAREKLDNFYNIAFAFVEIRKGFSVKIDGKIHNKQNCGYFHNFHFGGDTVANPILDENHFFKYVLEKYQYIDPELQVLLVQYLKTRGPDNARTQLECGDPNMIKLRHKIEQSILFYFEKYNHEISQ